MDDKCDGFPEECKGPVELRPAPSGSGFSYYRCLHHHQKVSERVQQVRERYPEGPTPPDWFDSSYAGERWDEED